MSEQTSNRPDKASNPYKEIEGRSMLRDDRDEFRATLIPRDVAKYSEKLYDEYKTTHVQAKEFEKMAVHHADRLVSEDIDERPKIDVEARDVFHTGSAARNYHDEWQRQQANANSLNSESGESGVNRQDKFAQNAFAEHVAKAILRRNQSDAEDLLFNNRQDGKLRQAAVAEAMLDGVEIKEESK